MSDNASTRVDVDRLRALIEAQTWGHDDDLVGPFSKDQIEPLVAEVERLRDGIHRLDAAVDRHRWAIERGHDNEPELGDQSAKALRDLVALLDDRTETT